MLEIRPLQKTDSAQKYFALLSELTSAPEQTQEEFAERLDEIEKCGNIKIFIIVDGDEIMASGTLVMEKKFIRGMATLGHIEDIVVSSKHRGKKLGKMIVNHLIDYARNQGCYKVVLYCTKDTTPFYEHLGLELKGDLLAMYL